MFMNAFTQDRIRDPRKKKSDKTYSELTAQLLKTNIYFSTFLICYNTGKSHRQVGKLSCLSYFSSAGH